MLPVEMQLAIFNSFDQSAIKPPAGQLLKWIGNKQRFSAEIASYFPRKIGTYFEPFLGSGALLGTLAPKKAFASDVFEPLIEISTPGGGISAKDRKALAEWEQRRK